MSDINKIRSIHTKVKKIARGFCTMKWLHQTLHLHIGATHSCYLPPIHFIPLEEIANNPSALHNTSYKKEQRKLMLEGGKPKECSICWNIEKTSKSNISNRMQGNAKSYAVPMIDTISKMDWSEDINPRYLEVSFGNSCNLACGYCSPTISTKWTENIKKYGEFLISDKTHYSIDYLKNGIYYKPNDHNPYEEAFWKWWPSLINELTTLRVTGGEPLLNKSAMKVLLLLDQDPAPNLNLAYNTNLGVSDKKINDFNIKIKNLVDNQKIKSFNLFTSVEGIDARAEYMRTGLNYKKWESNLINSIELGFKPCIMVTYNVLCVVNFKKFLEKIIQLRKQYNKNSLDIAISYLVNPKHWNVKTLPKEYSIHIDKQLKFMQENRDWFFPLEYQQLSQVRDYMLTNRYNEEEIKIARQDFYNFFNESDKRNNTNILEIFPEYTDFLELCKNQD